MNPLKAILRAKIEKNGPIALSRYTDICLNHPQYGYYQNKEIFGIKGDFITAPEISQIFGELIGLWFVQCWYDRKCPKNFTLLELGAGRGTMMEDIWRVTKKFPDFQKEASFILIENSSYLRNIQQKRLHELSAKWQNNYHNLPSQPLFAVANEFFDALGIEQFTRTTQGWAKKYIDVQNDDFIAQFLPCPAPPFARYRDENIKIGDIVEYSPASVKIATKLSAVIKEFGGVMLVIDYGDWYSSGDTLQALTRHKITDPLAEPGRADISAHVDFYALSQASADTGLQFTRLTPQGLFLNRLGARERTGMLSKNLSPQALDIHLKAYKRLTSPDEMGNLFKVMGFYRAQDPIMPGFMP